MRQNTWCGYFIFDRTQISGVQDPDFGVQSGRILGMFWNGLDIVSHSTGSRNGLSKWRNLCPCKKTWYGI